SRADGEGPGETAGGRPRGPQPHARPDRGRHGERHARGNREVPEGDLRRAPPRLVTEEAVKFHSLSRLHVWKKKPRAITDSPLLHRCLGIDAKSLIGKALSDRTE